MQEEKQNHDRILDFVVQKDEVTWQSMIYDLVNREHMDPWDIDVSKLSKRYLQMLKNLKHLDFRVSGKVVLAAAILLKIKSQKLLNEDIVELDRLMSPEEEMSEDEFYNDLEHERYKQPEVDPLVPRTPQPRKRKVSIYDLMSALNKALEVRDRRVLRNIPSVRIEVPAMKINITQLIETLHQKIKNFSGSEKLTFRELTKDDRQSKLKLFVPLLHLANSDQRKIDLVQNEHFGDIEIVLRDPNQPSDAPVQQ